MGGARRDYDLGVLTVTIVGLYDVLKANLAQVQVTADETCIPVSMAPHTDHVWLCV